MWNRALFKQNAKIPLQTTFGNALVVTIILSIVSSFSGRFFSIVGSLSPDFLTGYDFGWNYLGFSGIGWISFAFAIVVVNVMEVGIAGFYLENRHHPASIARAFDGFRYNYGNTVLTMAIRQIIITLGTILLVVPGIILYFCYFAVPYLLAENPNMNWKTALDLSNRMTRGYKAELFVLELSFIGWYLLGALACGVGMFLVDPYNYSTHAEAYVFLRQNAIDRGIIHPEEFQPQPYGDMGR